MITLDQLMACTGASQSRASIALADALDVANSAMDLYAINTPARIGMFLANVGHETGGLHWLREIWGPTPAQRRYEGRADLGNTQPGDGPRFMGRGWLQTTGRANYAALRDRLRKRGVDCPDFVATPQALEQPEWGALSATDFADMKRLNDLADRGAFTDYCVRVNGGLNGIEERTALWRAAQQVLA
jgi:putative chitinase